MILQLNNFNPINNPSITNMQIYNLSATSYPEQRREFIGKKIKIKFYDQVQGIVMNRLHIRQQEFPEYKGKNTGDIWTFKVLRWDEEYPNRVVLIDRAHRVIVTRTHELEKLVYHIGYKAAEDEITFNKVDWESFNKEYKQERLFVYPIQDQLVLGKPVYTEYIVDMLSKDENNQNTFNVKSQVTRREELIVNLKLGNPKLDVYPDNLLMSFPHYHNRHLEDYNDTPFKAINAGFIIRADEASEDNHVVVYEKDNEGNDRFIVDDEAFIYFDAKVKNIYIGELNLWNQQLQI